MIALGIKKCERWVYQAEKKFDDSIAASIMTERGSETDGQTHKHTEREREREREMADG